MKGHNTLALNAATIIEAVQEYLNKRAAIGFPADRVDSVTFINGHYHFITSERKKEEETK
jgi:hypothetical protein